MSLISNCNRCQPPDTNEIWPGGVVTVEKKNTVQPGRTELPAGTRGPENTLTSHKAIKWRVGVKNESKNSIRKNHRNQP